MVACVEFLDVKRKPFSAAALTSASSSGDEARYVISEKAINFSFLTINANILTVRAVWIGLWKSRVTERHHQQELGNNLSLRRSFLCLP